MILPTAGALTDPQLPARASNVYTTDAKLGGIGRVASTGWHRPGPPLKKNPGYAGVHLLITSPIASTPSQFHSSGLDCLSLTTNPPDHPRLCSFSIFES